MKVKEKKQQKIGCMLKCCKVSHWNNMVVCVHREIQGKERLVKENQATASRKRRRKQVMQTGAQVAKSNIVDKAKNKLKLDIMK